MPLQHRRIYATPDPTETFTVAWVAPDLLGGGTTNFGMSYRESAVVDAHTWSLEVVEPAGFDVPASKKMHKGVTFWSLVETNKSDPWSAFAEPKHNMLWTTSTVSEGTIDMNSHMCCGKTSSTISCDAAGSVSSPSPSPSSQQAQQQPGQQQQGQQQQGQQQQGQQQQGQQQNGGRRLSGVCEINGVSGDRIVGARILPFPTYTAVDVKDMGPFGLAADIGGVKSILDTLAAMTIALWLFTQSKLARHGDSSNDANTLQKVVPTDS